MLLSGPAIILAVLASVLLGTKTTDGEAVSWACELGGITSIVDLREVEPGNVWGIGPEGVFQFERGEWTLGYDTDDQRGRALDFVNTQHGWAAGDFGIVEYGPDGWGTPVDLPETIVSIIDLDMVAIDSGWALAIDKEDERSGLTLLRYSGEGWRPELQHFQGRYDRLIAIGDGQVVIYGRDGEANYRIDDSSLKLSFAEPLWNVILSGKDGWAVGGGGGPEQRGATVYTLRQGTWVPVYSDGGYTLYAIGQLSSGDLIAGGANGRIVIFSDGEWVDIGNVGGGKYSAIRVLEVSASHGRSWLGMSGEIGPLLVEVNNREWRVEYGLPARRVSASESGYAWAVVGGSIFVRHEDGWRLDLLAENGGTLFDVAAIDGSDAWAVGSVNPTSQAKPAIYRFNGVEWVPFGFESHAQDARMSLRRIVFSSPDSGWLMGTRYTPQLEKLEMVFFQYEGVSWDLKGALEVDEVLVDFDVGDDGSVWAIGPGLLVRLDEAGWQRTELPSGGRNVRSVSAVDSENGWIAANGSVFALNDGSWEVVDIDGASEDDPRWAAVDVDSTGDVWLAGSQGYVARLVDAAWRVEKIGNMSEIAPGIPWGANDIAVSTDSAGASTIYVAGDASTLLHGHSAGDQEPTPRVFIPLVRLR